MGGTVEADGPGIYSRITQGTPESSVAVGFFPAHSFIVRLFSAVLCLHPCTGCALVAASGSTLAVVCRLLIAGASLVAEHRLEAHGSSWA